MHHYYRLSSRGDNAIGSVHPFVYVCVWGGLRNLCCAFLCTGLGEYVNIVHKILIVFGKWEEMSE